MITNVIVCIFGYNNYIRYDQETTSPIVGCTCPPEMVLCDEVRETRLLF